MTMFNFMINAFYAMAGIICIAIAAVIVYAAITGIHRGLNGAKNGQRKK